MSDIAAMATRKFTEDQQVRIKASAFPGSDEPEDIKVRGLVGEIVAIVDETDEGVLYWWSNGVIDTYPIDSEIEAA